MIGYVKIKDREKLLGTLHAVPTGATRTSETGDREAEFLVITPKSNLGRVWRRRDEVLAE